MAVGVACASTAAVVSATFETGTLAEGLGIVLLWLFAASSIFSGVLALRSHDYEAPHNRMWWLCELPLPFVDHRYRLVSASESVPRHWTCRRCGLRRWSEPKGIGDTVEGPRAMGLRIDRDE